MPRQITLGDITIDLIVEQDSVPFIDFRTFFPDLAPDVLEANRSWLEPRYLDPVTGKIVITVQSYLVRSKTRIVACKPALKIPKKPGK